MSFLKKLFGKKENETSTTKENLNDYSGSRTNQNNTLASENQQKQNNEHEETKKVDVSSEFQNFMKSMNTENTPEKFSIEIYDSLKRYHSSPTYRFELNLTDDNGVTYELHEAFNAVYDQWKTISSEWDRRSLLFSFWDESELNNLEKWQLIERYNNDRSPIESMNYQKHLVEEDYRDARLIVALSKTHRLLTNYGQAQKYIEFAYESLPNNEKVKVEYANILHLSENPANKQKAHDLMNEVLKTKIERSEAKQIGLLNFFLFSENYIDSSIFAALYLNDDSATLEDWSLLANEYYYCPNFRYEHAVKLANNGDGLGALAKLNSLSDEFPWFRKGVTETIAAIKKFRAQMNNPQFMDEEMKQLEYYLTVGKN